jgi:hypothetical protein
MNAANYDIIIDRAAFFRMSLTIYDDTGSTVDVSTATFYADIRDKSTKKEITQFSIGPLSDGADGKVYIDLPEVSTKLLTEFNSYEYDLFMIRSGKTSRLLVGDVIVRNNITNNV